MTDKEKIRAEIERLIVPTSRDLTFADSISNRTLQKVLKIIDHIPDNEDSDDLETFARSAVFNHPHQFDLKSEFGIDADIELYTPDDMFEAVIKGAHWQHEQMMKNAVMETTVMVDCDGDGIETPYAIATENSLRLAEISDADFQSWLMDVANGLQPWAITVVQALPASVLMLMMGQ